jgi:Membrane bound beta barrel domain (DUF5777)
VNRVSLRLLIAVFVTAAFALPVSAQDDDAVLNLAEPDFTLLALPTGLRLPKFKSAFRVTHRFTRPLGQGDFDDLLSDFFGIDSGAQIGLEYRFGIIRNGQVGVYRTSNKTIEFFGEYGISRQGHQLPADVTALFTIEGTNNFRDSYSPALGAIVSRRFGTRAAAYIEPIWVDNTNPLPSPVVDHNNTFMVGLGTRVRILATVYLVGEVSPRAAGYKPGATYGSFGVEKRVGGHVFQLNFSDSIGTTMAQIARGRFTSSDWFLGFNISRKFY